MADKDAPEAVQRALVAGSGGNNGPNGLNEQDAMDNCDQVTQAGRSITARKYRQDLTMGLGHATTSHPDFRGLVSDRNISENNQRHFYARWQEFMNAASWSDVHIDPITATFAGSATFKG